MMTLTRNDDVGSETKGEKGQVGDGSPSCSDDLDESTCQSLKRRVGYMQPTCDSMGHSASICSRSWRREGLLVSHDSHHVGSRRPTLDSSSASIPPRPTDSEFVSACQPTCTRFSSKYSRCSGALQQSSGPSPGTDDTRSYQSWRNTKQ